jgi:hypothetical protein
MLAHNKKDGVLGVICSGSIVTSTKQIASVLPIDMPWMARLCDGLFRSHALIGVDEMGGPVGSRSTRHEKPGIHFCEQSYRLSEFKKI